MDTLVRSTVCVNPYCHDLSRNDCHRVGWPLISIRHCLLKQIELQYDGCIGRCIGRMDILEDKKWAAGICIT